jgi:hypothetical protein
MHALTAGRLLAALSFACLTACGGGGGGAGGGPAAPQTLSFTPNPVALNVKAENIGVATVWVTMGQPDLIQSDKWVLVEDSDNVLLDYDIVPIDSTHFSINVQTPASLSLGHHRGQFTVHMCRDAACGTEWAGGPWLLPYDVDVEPEPLAASPLNSTSLTVHMGETSSQMVQIAVHGNGLQWSATTTSDWLQVDGASHSGEATIDAQFAPQAMPVGDYTDQVTIHTTDGQSYVVPVMLHVIAQEFSVVGGVPTFTAVNGAPIAAQPFEFALDGNASLPWSISSDAAWMSLSATSGTTPATVLLQPVTSSLSGGEYDAHLTLSGQGIQPDTVDSHLSLVKPTMTIANQSIVMGGALGRVPMTFTVPIALDTGTNSYSLSVNAPDWVTISAPASVNGAGSTFTLETNYAKVPLGTVNGTVTFTTHVNGDTVTAPISVVANTDQRALLPSNWAIGLASTPTGTVLSRSLTIRDNFGAALPWTAVSSAPWLHVTPSGTTGTTTLVLTADPSLASDGDNIATIHVATTNVNTTAADIRVGLWKDATGLPAGVGLMGIAASEMAADRVLPYVYVANGGTTVDVYNAYTAAKVATIGNVGSQITSMSVSPDGSTLYVLDPISEAVQLVDLVTRKKKGSWYGITVFGAGTNTRQASLLMAVVRPNGREFVVLDNGMIIDGHAVFAVTPGDTPPSIASVAIADDQSSIAEYQTWPRGMSVHTLDYSAFGGMQVGYPHFLDTLYKNVGLAIDPSGLVYAAGDARCRIYDPSGLPKGSLPGGDANTNNIVITSNLRPVCAAYTAAGAPADLWVHALDGTVLQTWRVAGDGHGLLTRQMYATPDGFVIVGLTDDPMLAFVPIGP